MDATNDDATDDAHDDDDADTGRSTDTYGRCGGGGGSIATTCHNGSYHDYGYQQQCRCGDDEYGVHEFGNESCRESYFDDTDHGTINTTTVLLGQSHGYYNE